MQLRPGELQMMRQLVLQLAGVSLDDSKGYLIETRLGPLAEKAGCANFNELYFRLRYASEGPLQQQVVDAITTHETTFFRDGGPYDALQFKLLPEVLDARERMGQAKKLRIWSAEPVARADIANRIGSSLLPHGWLVVGASENLMDLGAQFAPQTHCRATVYQPNAVPARR